MINLPENDPMMQDRLGAARDDIYAALMAAHEGLSDESSSELNARLILLMANEIGDADRLKRLFQTARDLA